MESFSADTVEEQLERIMASPDFVSGTKMGQFLSYVVSQTLDGDQARIKQYNIAVDALGYGPQFDPMTNPTVRILAGRVRRALDRYYQHQGAEDPIRIEIPKGSYVPVFSPYASKFARTPGQRPRESKPPTIAVVAFENASEGDSDSVIAVGLTAEIVVSLTRFVELTVLGPFTESSGDLSQYGARFALQGWIRTSGSTVRITTDLLDTFAQTSIS